jgi:hypothetical protein
LQISIKHENTTTSYTKFIILLIQQKYEGKKNGINKKNIKNLTLVSTTNPHKKIATKKKKIHSEH